MFTPAESLKPAAVPEPGNAAPKFDAVPPVPPPPRTNTSSAWVLGSTLLEVGFPLGVAPFGKVWILVVPMPPWARASAGPPTRAPTRRAARTLRNRVMVGSHGAVKRALANRLEAHGLSLCQRERVAIVAWFSDVGRRERAVEGVVDRPKREDELSLDVTGRGELLKLHHGDGDGKLLVNERNQHSSLNPVIYVEQGHVTVDGKEFDCARRVSAADVHSRAR